MSNALNLPPPVPQKKKRSRWVLPVVLGLVGGVLLLGFVVLVGIGLFVLGFWRDSDQAATPVVYESAVIHDPERLSASDMAVEGRAVTRVAPTLEQQAIISSQAEGLRVLRSPEATGAPRAEKRREPIPAIRTPVRLSSFAPRISQGLFARIDADGTIHLGAETVPADQLEARFRAYATEHPNAEVRIEVSRKAPDKYVVPVIDSANRAGFSRISIRRRDD